MGYLIAGFQHDMMATAIRKISDAADAAIGLLIVEPQLKLLLPNPAFSEPSLHVVKEPVDFGGLFKAGESVVRLHIDAVARTSVHPLSHMRETFRKLRDAGYAGIFGDTPNERIVDFAVKHYDATFIDTPEDEAKRVSANYAKHAEYRGYPKEYSLKPVKRVMIRF